MSHFLPPAPPPKGDNLRLPCNLPRWRGLGVDKALVIKRCFPKLTLYVYVHDKSEIKFCMSSFLKNLVLIVSSPTLKIDKSLLPCFLMGIFFPFLMAQIPAIIAQINAKLITAMRLLILSGLVICVFSKLNPLDIKAPNKSSAPQRYW